MKDAIDNVINKAIRKPGDDTNLLYIPYDGNFEWMMSSVPVRLYAPSNSLSREWPCNNFPQSLNWLPAGANFIPNRIDIQAVVVNFRKEAVHNAAGIAHRFHVPLVIVDHELPTKEASSNLKRFINSQLPPGSVYVTPHSMVNESWAYSDTMESYNIPYGFEKQEQSIKQNDVLVVGDYAPEDAGLLSELLNCHTKVMGIGHNGSRTTPYTSMKDLIYHMSNSQVCVVIFQEHRPPFFAMLAAACGCAVVTNRTRWTESVFENKTNAILFDNIDSVKRLVRELIHSDTLDDMALAGQEMIERDHSINKFRDGWIDLLNDLSTRIYIR